MDVSIQGNFAIKVMSLTWVANILTKFRLFERLHGFVIIMLCHSFTIPVYSIALLSRFSICMSYKGFN